MASGFESLRMIDASVKARVEQALLQSFFTDFPPGYPETPAGRADVANHVDGRYNRCVDHVLPWLGRYIELGGAELVELGCGTGSITAALARVARHVTGYDIHAPSMAAARGRMEAMGLSNTDLNLVEPSRLLDVLRERNPRGADVFLLYAVLEHQTPAERLETLRIGWEMLRPGGLLVVVDTPNRLTYFDAHTSLLPFFHLLPPELALPYVSRSPRALLRDLLARVPPEEGPITLTRWGLGASYHELELALGDCEPLLVGTGFEPEILEMFPVNLEEELLRFYVEKSGLRVPLAFTRNTLNFVLRKGDNTGLLARRSVPPPLQRIEEPQARLAAERALAEARATLQSQAMQLQKLEHALAARESEAPPLRYKLADQLNSVLKQTALHRHAQKLVAWSLERAKRGRH